MSKLTSISFANIICILFAKLYIYILYVYRDQYVHIPLLLFNFILSNIEKEKKKMKLYIKSI